MEREEGSKEGEGACRLHMMIDIGVFSVFLDFQLYFFLFGFPLCFFWPGGIFSVRGCDGWGKTTELLRGVVRILGHVAQSNGKASERREGACRVYMMINIGVSSVFRDVQFYLFGFCFF